VTLVGLLIYKKHRHHDAPSYSLKQAGLRDPLLSSLFHETMTLKRYLSTLVFPISPRRPRIASIDSPVSARSPIEDLRDFWRATFEESLKQGEKYREDALARMRAQRGLLSDAEVWDFSTGLWWNETISRTLPRARRG